MVSQTPITDLLPNTGIYLQLVRFTLVLLGGLLFTQVILVPMLTYLLRRRNTRKETRHSVRNLASVVGIFISFTVALEAGNFGNLVTVIGAVAAALTVAIGFGMRDQISNVVAGFFIFLQNPFYVGDYIKTEDTEGVIEEITILHTVLKGSSSQSIIVPNSQLTMEEVKNYTRESTTKASISVSLPPDSISEGTRLLEAIADDHSDVRASPAPEIVFTDHEGAVLPELHYWLDDSRASKRVKSEILEEFNDRAVTNDLFDSASDQDA